jgi:STE20-like kinase
MLQRKEEELIKRQTIEKRALPKRIRAERKARDMMFRESLRISIHHEPKAEEEKIKKVRKTLLIQILLLLFFLNLIKLIKIIAKQLIFAVSNLLKQFQEQEKKRYMQEQQRFETKHMKQLEELRANCDSTIRYIFFHPIPINDDSSQ